MLARPPAHLQGALCCAARQEALGAPGSAARRRAARGRGRRQVPSAGACPPQWAPCARQGPLHAPAAVGLVHACGERPQRGACPLSNSSNRFEAACSPCGAPRCQHLPSHTHTCTARKLPRTGAGACCAPLARSTHRGARRPAAACVPQLSVAHSHWPAACQPRLAGGGPARPLSGPGKGLLPPWLEAAMQQAACSGGGAGGARGAAAPARWPGVPGVGRRPQRAAAPRGGCGRGLMWLRRKEPDASKGRGTRWV